MVVLLGLAVYDMPSRAARASPGSQDVIGRDGRQAVP